MLRAYIIIYSVSDSEQALYACEPYIYYRIWRRFTSDFGNFIPARIAQIPYNIALNLALFLLRF